MSGTAVEEERFQNIRPNMSALAAIGNPTKLFKAAVKVRLTLTTLWYHEYILIELRNEKEYSICYNYCGT